MSSSVYSFCVNNTNKTLKNKYKSLKDQRKGGKYRNNDCSSENEENVSVFSYVEDPRAQAKLKQEEDKRIAKESKQTKLLQALQNATEKSAPTRSQALQFICENIMQNYMPEFVKEHKAPITKAVEKSLRRGNGTELMWSARLATLLALQLGADSDTPKTLNQLLLNILQVENVLCASRSQCCTALGLINFFSGEDSRHLKELMLNFKYIFCDSYLMHRQGSCDTIVNSELATLHAECISSWALLLTLLPASEWTKTLEKSNRFMPSIEDLTGLLQSPHLTVRLAAGEAIVILIEKGRSHTKHFLKDYKLELCNVVRDLANDSTKYRAKHDRKTQKANFRDILKYLEDDIAPQMNIRFGYESLLIDSWALHQQYSALCSIVGPGLTLHMKQNDIIRNIFQITKNSDDEVITRLIETKQIRMEKATSSATSFKKHPRGRGKYSDKHNLVYV